MRRNFGPIRVGRISYTNVWPIFHYFSIPQTDNHRGIEIVNQVPAQLNEGMSSGTIDMGPISSFAYGDAYPNYVLFPDLSVSAFGKVGSILLFHKEPLEHIVDGKIALPKTSASSVALLKIILQKFYGGWPTYDYEEPCLEKMMQGKDAALLIGDDAIRENWHNTKYRVTDLGEKWQQFTGLWMSFAVWAVRKDTLERNANQVAALYQAFLESKQKAARNPQPMIAEARRQIGGTEVFWQHYFAHLNYDFGPQQWRGLETYFRYAKELGLLDREITLELWSDNTMAQVKN